MASGYTSGYVPFEELKQYSSDQLQELRNDVLKKSITIAIDQIETGEVLDFAFTSVVQAIPPEHFEDVIFKPTLPKLVAILDEVIPKNTIKTMRKVF